MKSITQSISDFLLSMCTSCTLHLSFWWLHNTVYVMKADERTIQIARITFGSSSQTFQSTGQQQPDPNCQELLTAHLSKNGNLYDIYSTFPRKNASEPRNGPFDHESGGLL